MFTLSTQVKIESSKTIGIAKGFFPFIGCRCNFAMAFWEGEEAFSESQERNIFSLYCYSLIIRWFVAQCKFGAKIRLFFKLCFCIEIILGNTKRNRGIIGCSELICESIFYCDMKGALHEAGCS